MAVEWEMIRSGPADAEHGVLLLPGGTAAARSYAAVMAEPALGHVRLVAATLPGHAGTPPPDDFSIETYARLATDLAGDTGCDVVAGFSIGATVAMEMVTSGAFTGPAVLLGISPSPADEPAFFRGMVRLGAVLGGLPAAALVRTAALGSRIAKVSDEHRVEMREDFAKNDPQVIRQVLSAYLEHLGRDDDPAGQLCAAGVPTWVVHAEKGDGGLTDQERSTLEVCPHVRVVTIPGTCLFLPDEKPDLVAGVIAEAVMHAA